jgi:hypothetical protein
MFVVFFVLCVFAQVRQGTRPWHCSSMLPGKGLREPRVHSSGPRSVRGGRRAHHHGELSCTAWPVGRPMQD